jgi:hypothetical protein
MPNTAFRFPHIDRLELPSKSTNSSFFFRRTWSFLPHRPVTVYIFNDIISGIFNFDPLRGSEFTDIIFSRVLTYVLFFNGSISFFSYY